jgi:hypothetical protein
VQVALCLCAKTPVFPVFAAPEPNFCPIPVASQYQPESMVRTRPPPDQVGTSEPDPMEDKMVKFVKCFLRDDSGAVTVDWVVLTAAVVGLAAAAYIGIENQTNLLADAAADDIAAEIAK